MSCLATAPAAGSELDLPPEALIFGASEPMQVVRRQVETAANAHVPVLIGGESGTGKEVLAKLIHRRSPWRTGAFVKVNCPSISGTRLEGELLGCQPGAFTVTRVAKPDRVQTAERGTLFLDEIAELKPALQAKLAQLLQDSRFCRVGGQQERAAELRVICATKHDLADDVAAGRFRRDLFSRINALSIALPPLTERRRDIPALARYLVEKYAVKYGRPAPPVNARILELLGARLWPGNIRELENAIKRYVILGSEEAFAIPANSVRPGGNFHGSGIAKYTGPNLPGDAGEWLKSTVRHAVKELERDFILRTLEANRWNRRLAARALRISYAALLYRMREAGLPPPRGTQAPSFSEPAGLHENPGP